MVFTTGTGRLILAPKICQVLDLGRQGSAQVSSDLYQLCPPTASSRGPGTLGRGRPAGSLHGGLGCRHRPRPAAASHCAPGADPAQRPRGLLVGPWHPAPVPGRDRLPPALRQQQRPESVPALGHLRPLAVPCGRWAELHGRGVSTPPRLPCPHFLRAKRGAWKVL